MRIDRDLAVGEKRERVAVGLRLRDEIGRDVAVRADAVLHHHRLADVLRELLADDARRDVGRPARRNRNQDGDRPRRELRRRQR
jgi:hypothetical protein